MRSLSRSCFRTRFKTSYLILSTLLLSGIRLTSLTSNAVFGVGILDRSVGYTKCSLPGRENRATRRPRHGAAAGRRYGSEKTGALFLLSWSTRRPVFVGTCIESRSSPTRHLVGRRMNLRSLVRMMCRYRPRSSPLTRGGAPRIG